MYSAMWMELLHIFLISDGQTEYTLLYDKSWIEMENFWHGEEMSEQN